METGVRITELWESRKASNKHHRSHITNRQEKVNYKAPCADHYYNKKD